jgi:hypothetical protein
VLATPPPTTRDTATSTASFQKTEAGSSLGGKKKPRLRRYVPMEFARQLFDKDRLAPWQYASLRGGWHLSSVPREGCKHRDEIRRHRICAMIRHSP